MRQGVWDQDVMFPEPLGSQIMNPRFEFDEESK